MRQRFSVKAVRQTEPESLSSREFTMALLQGRANPHRIATIPSPGRCTGAGFVGRTRVSASSEPL